LESESTLEIEDIINEDGKVFIKSKEQPRKENLSGDEKCMAKR
jgi:hypothetical protein